jgi:hypothetical protein
VRHFHIFQGPWSTDWVVKHVRMTCQRLGGPEFQDVIADSTGVSTLQDNKRFSCNDRFWGTGITGRFGRVGGSPTEIVANLGFVCSHIPPH